MSSSSAAREPRFEFASSGRHLVATGVVRHVEPRSWVGTGVARAVEEVLAAPLEAPQLVVGVLPFDSARPGMLYRPAEACWRSCAFPGRPEPFAPSASTTAVTDRRPSHEGYRCLVAKAVETIRSGGLNNARLHHAKALTGLYQPGRLLERITLYFPAAVRARPQPRRARLEHCQKQYRGHPARDPGPDLRSIRLIYHRTHRRLRLRTPTQTQTRNRSCFMIAIESGTHEELDAEGRLVPSPSFTAKRESGMEGQMNEIIIFGKDHLT